MVNPSRYLKIGPGGRQCTCCFPAPRSKDRRAQFRSAKRKAEREALKQAEHDQIDIWNEFLELQEAMEAEDQYWSDYDNGVEYDTEKSWYEESWYGEDPYDDDWLDDYIDDDHYSNYDDDYGDSFYHQSEQEKVARVLSYALIGDELDWRQHLTNAKRFMEAMKRNGQ